MLNIFFKSCIKLCIKLFFFCFLILVFIRKLIYVVSMFCINDFDFIWDVYVFVFDINCVDIYFFGDEFNVVVVVI